MRSIEAQPAFIWEIASPDVGNFFHDAGFILLAAFFHLRHNKLIIFIKSTEPLAPAC